MTSLKKLSFTVLLLFVLFSITIAQNNITNNYHLTHAMSPDEKAQMANYQRTFVETDPPEGEVRNIAEWEPMEGVLIAYDYGFGIPYSLIAEMSQDCRVTEENTVRSYFTSNGVNLDNCDFVYHGTDSYWTRDFSPWYIAVDNQETAIINFPYNRPRPNDNDTPIEMAIELGLDLYGMDVTHTGGNYMCDGYGNAASTTLVWDEETQTQEQIREKMNDYLGIENYIVLEDPMDDYIEHIDCWGKFLDVDKVLITQVPESDYRYEDYEATADYFAETNCSWGYPYEVIRVQAAASNAYDTNPYTNSLILNNKVFVPISGSAFDDDALAVYEQAMPGYEIIGVLSNGWINSDALHCRTHGIADHEMLYIKHYPLFSNQGSLDEINISAYIRSYGGSPISDGFPILHYNLGDKEWQQIEMELTSGYEYTATIVADAGEYDVEYYISAENDNDKSESHPLIGESDPHTFSYISTHTVSTDEVEGSRISVYPNPTTGMIFINTFAENGIFEIYNSIGKKVKSGVLTGKNSKVNLSGSASGLYILKIKSEDKELVESIILK